MSATYIDGDTIQDARNAHGMGVPLQKIAGHLGVSEPELRQALGIPLPAPQPVNDAGMDLFAAVDRLDAIL